VIRRLDHLRSDARLEVHLVARGRVLDEQTSCWLRLHSSCWWVGTFFPLISEALKAQTEGQRWARVVRQVTRCRLALVWCCLAGIVAAADLATRVAGLAAADLLLPLGVSALAFAALLAFTDAGPQLDLACDVHADRRSSYRSSARSSERQGGRRTPGDDQGAAADCAGADRRAQRRALGGYIVHVGIAILSCGVAAVVSLPLCSATCRISRGRRRRLAATRSSTCAPTADVGKDTAGTGAPISLGAVLDVSKDGKHTIVRPKRNFYPVNDPSVPMIAASSKASPPARSTCAGV